MGVEGAAGQSQVEVLGGQGGKGRDHCTVPDQLVVDKELEFRVEVGKTDTEGGPVVGLEHRQEVVDGRAVSTTHKHATGRRVRRGYEQKQQTHTHAHIIKYKMKDKGKWEEYKQVQREKEGKDI